MATPQRVLVTGQMKSGKTYFCNKLIERFVGKRKIVIWCSYDHPDYGMYAKIDLEGLPDFLSDKTRLGPYLCVCDGEVFVQSVAQNLNQSKARRGIVIFDDSSNIYPDGRCSKAFKDMINGSRNLNYDVFFQTHSLQRCPIFLFGFLTKILKFKTHDILNAKLCDRIANPTLWHNLQLAEAFLSKKVLKDHEYVVVETGND